MNNLHRELAPISDAAWAQIEEETTRTLKRYLAGRRVVDVEGPAASAFPRSGPAILRPSRRQARACLRDSARSSPWSRSGSPSTSIASKSTTSSVARMTRTGSRRRTPRRESPTAEDRAIFEGYAAAQIEGIRQGTSNPIMTLPADVRQYPDAIAQALSQLRLVGVNGPIRSCSARTPIPRSPRRSTRLSGARSCQEAGQGRDHLGPAIDGALSLQHAAATSTCTSAKTSRSAI